VSTKEEREEKGKRKEERGKRKEERGKREEGRGKTKSAVTIGKAVRQHSQIDHIIVQQVPTTLISIHTYRNSATTALFSAIFPSSSVNGRP
jgi:hypothetical protein